ncbi:MAG: DNA mismatch repair protein MutS [Lachnospiraceae bacterium]|nr:DNA mismatch repair protein MutS [Lachnospiraceae bacterium]
MMQHYLATKKEYPDCILFYRLGDFYEMFFEDAQIVSRELELTLTGKNCGMKERAPMCGVPFHAVDNFLNRLVSKGYKVAICEQLEDPATAKGIVKRDVVRVVTPGTNTNVSAMDAKDNSFIMCVSCSDEFYGVSVCDVTTGELYVFECEGEREFTDQLSKFMPKEIICNPAFEVSHVNVNDIRSRLGISFFVLDPHFFDTTSAKKLIMEHFKVKSLDGLGLHDYTEGVVSLGALFRYLYETQKNELSNIISITPYSTRGYMLMDSFAIRNLELTETLREKQKKGSLLWVLDHTKTAMGGRKLKKLIEQPLISVNEINKRLDAVTALNENVYARDEIREYLSGVYDLERLMCRVCFSSANPRDMIALKESVKVIPAIRNCLKDLSSELITSLYESIDPLEDVFSLIDNAIVEEPPLIQKSGGIIKPGYSKEADELREKHINGKQYLADMEEKEREKTGIKNLKIKFSKVFGYSFEVTNSYLDLVPDYFIRKQTLTGGERFITEELSALADSIMNAEEKLNSLEYELFDEIRRRTADQMERIGKTARALAFLDVLASFSYVCERNDYVRPVIADDGIINIKDGRHPVVEKMTGHESFVKNDLILDNNENTISIITGPNMAGKSTYMRQTALIVLMASIGCFVPASEAHICIVDRIFTRVGASDDLSSGQSTFMVEMTEVANILRNATPKSLLVLDEIGRGTSTFDGLSIAWAVVEYINEHLNGAKTLFATHYHELTELEGKLKGVANYCFAVREKGDEVVFLRKVIKGSADKSYGIHVASLAGVPEEVVVRAEELLTKLTSGDIISGIKRIAMDEETKQAYEPEKVAEPEEYHQFSFFDNFVPSKVEEALREIDINNISPIEALNKLNELKAML